MPIAVRHDLVIGRHRHAASRVICTRQFVERDETCPVVAVVPSRGGSKPFEIILRLADRHEARRQEADIRSEEHTSELQSLMRISYAVFCLKKKKNTHTS